MSHKTRSDYVLLSTRQAGISRFMARARMCAAFVLSLGCFMFVVMATEFAAPYFPEPVFDVASGPKLLIGLVSIAATTWFLFEDWYASRLGRLQPAR